MCEFLKQAGYRNFLGFTHTGSCWVTIKDDYMRMGRILITGDNLINNADWFDEILDPMSILDMAVREQF